MGHKIGDSISYKALGCKLKDESKGYHPDNMIINVVIFKREKIVNILIGPEGSYYLKVTKKEGKHKGIVDIESTQILYFPRDVNIKIQWAI